jgi:hypothetical protein
MSRLQHRSNAHETVKSHLVARPVSRIAFQGRLAPWSGSVRRTVVLMRDPGWQLPDDGDDPFERLAAKGPAARVPPLEPTITDAVPLVVLADEFFLTTIAALEMCDQIGLADLTRGTALTPSQAAAFRQAARQPTSPPPPPEPLSLARRLNRRR